MIEKEFVLNVRLDRKLHDDLVRTIAQCMIKDPSTRYTKSDFVREAIAHFLKVRKHNEINSGLTS